MMQFRAQQPVLLYMSVN